MFLWEDDYTSHIIKIKNKITFWPNHLPFLKDRHGKENRLTTAVWHFFHKYKDLFSVKGIEHFMTQKPTYYEVIVVDKCVGSSVERKIITLLIIPPFLHRSNFVWDPRRVCSRLFVNYWKKMSIDTPWVETKKIHSSNIKNRHFKRHRYCVVDFDYSLKVFLSFSNWVKATPFEKDVKSHLYFICATKKGEEKRIKSHFVILFWHLLVEGGNNFFSS